MKLIAFILTLFLLISCNNQKAINYSKINGIDDINEQVITDFYKNVLDTLIGDCYFQSKPILQTELIDKTHGFSGVSEQDQVFFKEQIDKFKSLRWENLTTNEKILSDSEIDTLFNQGARRGWEILEKNMERVVFVLFRFHYLQRIAKEYILIMDNNALLFGDMEKLLFLNLLIINGFLKSDMKHGLVNKLRWLTRGAM